MLQGCNFSIFSAPAGFVKPDYWGPLELRSHSRDDRSQAFLEEVRAVPGEHLRAHG